MVHYAGADVGMNQHWGERPQPRQSCLILPTRRDSMPLDGGMLATCGEPAAGWPTGFKQRLRPLRARNSRKMAFTESEARNRRHEENAVESIPTWLRRVTLLLSRLHALVPQGSCVFSAPLTPSWFLIAAPPLRRASSSL